MWTDEEVKRTAESRELIQKLCKRLRTTPDKIVKRTKKLLANIEKAEKTLEILKGKLGLN